MNKKILFVVAFMLTRIIIHGQTIYPWGSPTGKGQAKGELQSDSGIHFIPKVNKKFSGTNDSSFSLQVSITDSLLHYSKDGVIWPRLLWLNDTTLMKQYAAGGITSGFGWNVNSGTGNVDTGKFVQGDDSTILTHHFTSTTNGKIISSWQSYANVSGVLKHLSDIITTYSGDGTTRNANVKIAVGSNSTLGTRAFYGPHFSQIVGQPFEVRTMQDSDNYVLPGYFTVDNRYSQAPYNVVSAFVRDTGQTADIMQIQDYTGTPLARIDSVGNYFIPKLNITTPPIVGGILTDSVLTINKGTVKSLSAKGSFVVRDGQNALDTLRMGNIGAKAGILMFNYDTTSSVRTGWSWMNRMGNWTKKVRIFGSPGGSTDNSTQITWSTRGGSNSTDTSLQQGDVIFGNLNEARVYGSDLYVSGFWDVFLGIGAQYGDQWQFETSDGNNRLLTKFIVHPKYAATMTPMIIQGGYGSNSNTTQTYLGTAISGNSPRNMLTVYNGPTATDGTLNLLQLRSANGQTQRGDAINYVTAADSTNKLFRVDSVGDIYGATVNTFGTGDLTAQSAAVSSIASYTPTATGTYRIGVYLDITAVTTDIIKISVTFNDVHGTATTIDIAPQGTTSASVATTGFFAYPTIDVRAASGTAIIVKTTLVNSSGSIAYDVGATITKIK